MTRDQKRTMRSELVGAVLTQLARSQRVVSIVVDPTEPRRLIGQLCSGRFFAIHCKLPADEFPDPAKRYLVRAQAHGGVGFVVGDTTEVVSWLNRLDAARSLAA